MLKYSDAPSRFQEGIVGPLKSADLAPEILHALENLKEGEHSGAVRMRHGIHYVELETHTTPGKKTLDDVRAGIETKIMRDRFPEELQAYYKRLYEENPDRGEAHLPDVRRGHPAELTSPPRGALQNPGEAGLHGDLGLLHDPAGLGLADVDDEGRDLPGGRDPEHLHRLETSRRDGRSGGGPAGRGRADRGDREKSRGQKDRRERGSSHGRPGSLA